MRKILKSGGLLLLISIISIAICLCCINNETYASAAGEGVYIGGTPIGIVAKGDALLVTELVNVVTTKGAFSPSLQAGIQKGDLITKANGMTVNDIYKLNGIIADSSGAVVLEIRRNGVTMTISVEPVMDIVQNARKIGLQVKGELSGIGTLTYITQDDCFGALGHMITDEYGYSDVYQRGKIFECEVDGYIKGEQGKAGELRGKIVYTSGAIGTIDKNCLTGLFGTINDSEKAGRDIYPVGNREEITVGKAQILTTIDQNAPQFYDIEIVKTQKQDSISDKGMVIRITDEDLLVKTGGILQGMSGSPIVQNGVLIGAVTHVFISDPTMGYGVYIDWMINN